MTYYQDLQEPPFFHLVYRIVVLLAPATGAGVTLAPAFRDSINRDQFIESEAHTNHATFVDDNLMVELVPRIQLAIQRSTAACCLLFGHPWKGILTSKLSEYTFAPAAT